jgi:YfiH family protein
VNFFSCGQRPCDVRRYARFPRLERAAGLVHAFSTRPQDVSMRTNGDAPVRAARRAVMIRDLGLDPERLRCCVQVHGTAIHVADDRSPARVEGVDAIVTATPGLPIMTFSADCPLVLLFEPQRRVLGLAHASWRCTLAEIVPKVVALMAEKFGARPAAMLAGIGPSAGPDAYEVKDDVYEAAAGQPERERLFPRRDGRMYFDLWTANRLALERAGVPAEQIEVAGICTMTRTDVFYSFRREGAGCGHFGLAAAVLG